MDSSYLRYLIPLELPEAKPAVAERPAAERHAERLPERVVPAAATEEPVVSRSAFASRTASAAAAVVAPEPQRPAASAPPVGVAPDIVEALELRLAHLEGLQEALAAQAAATQVAEAQVVQLRREVGRLEKRLEELEEQPAPAAPSVRLPLGTALLVPLAGLGLNALVHFGLYQLFLRTGQPGSPLANFAAETLLGFHLATETAPHAYFYWMAVETLWTSLLIVLALGFILRRLRRASREERS